ncbi:DinB family protein [Aureibacter tunicatorum]|uniref:DinB-like domain-containing protein n=1 Tax=Aureibacter tunicatorum TaxID=866807 RepID=A0AAE3XLT8_9BACT|nr:DinB family protein [Aureibacter tunicatorum]MDR6238305.1 hypothetical protein [Aureibacter tunicatorum]BDD03337.1 hypothetical protein AUTU_08200 [Aureibacter tunicatorum]
MQNANIKIWKTNRKNLINNLEDLTVKELNHTPKGFNNNIIWNVGHALVSQQALIYSTSNLPMHISNELFNLFKSGTKPESELNAKDIALIKFKLTETMEITEKDLGSNIFKNFKSKTTRTGFHLGSLDDAISFNNYHEGIHYGLIMSIRKFI